MFARKKADPDLAAVAAVRLAAIIESSDDAIVSKTLDGTIMSWNAAAERIFGYSAASVEPGAYAELAVADSGQGIRPEQLPHIFEPFYTTKEVGQGTGLGLATVEGVVSQSGGHIQVASTIGRGTTFRILLPLAREPALAVGPRTPAPERARPRGRLLVVDDEESVREVVVRMLQGEGYEVLAAQHGEEALNYLEQVGGSVDLVITNLVMPVMGGRELTAELRRRHPNLSVVWMSGHPREVELRSAGQTKDLAILQKPIPPRVLSETIAQVFQQRLKD